jgi:hypothetical protein
LQDIARGIFLAEVCIPFLQEPMKREKLAVVGARIVRKRNNGWKEATK